MINYYETFNTQEEAEGFCEKELMRYPYEGYRTLLRVVSSEKTWHVLGIRSDSCE
jgi:hypothetical protein